MLPSVIGVQGCLPAARALLSSVSVQHELPAGRLSDEPLWPYSPPRYAPLTSQPAGLSQTHHQSPNTRSSPLTLRETACSVSPASGGLPGSGLAGVMRVLWNLTKHKLEKDVSQLSLKNTHHIIDLL